MKIIIDDKKFEGFHQYVFWNNRFFKSDDIDDTELHINWSRSLRCTLEASPMPEEFVPESCIIASHAVQVNTLFRKIKRAKGPFNVVLYSRDAGIQNQSPQNNRTYSSKQGHCITYNHHVRHEHETLNRIPNSVNKIFCSNVNFPSDTIICYPYGIMQDIASVIEQAWNSDIMHGPRKFCYANFDTKTNRTHRMPIWETISKNPRVDCFDPQDNPLALDEYVRELCSYKYVLCPKGNGIDTMRMWESIYCGAIPIVQKSGVSSCFSSSLPIVEVEDWNLDNEYLETVYPTVAYRLANLELTDKDYWRDRVNEL